MPKQHSWKSLGKGLFPTGWMHEASESREKIMCNLPPQIGSWIILLTNTAATRKCVGKITSFTESLVITENTPEKLFKTEICTGGPPVLCGKPWVRHSFNRNEQSYTDFEISQEYYDDFLVKWMWPSASQCKTIFI